MWKGRLQSIQLTSPWLQQQPAERWLPTSQCTLTTHLATPISALPLSKSRFLPSQVPKMIKLCFGWFVWKILETRALKSISPQCSGGRLICKRCCWLNSQCPAVIAYLWHVAWECKNTSSTDFKSSLCDRLPCNGLHDVGSFFIVIQGLIQSVR